LPAQQRSLDRVQHHVEIPAHIFGEESQHEIAVFLNLLIATHAYATGATIVTANADEFKRIRGLNVENWLA
jgi:predicted nucleic acid-binding protein